MNQKEFDTTLTRLTERRKEVLLKFLASDPDKVIAENLNITQSTVRKHIQEISNAFGLKNEFSDECRSKRQELITLFAKYKPELLKDSSPQDQKRSHLDSNTQHQNFVAQETVYNNTNFVRREEVLVELEGDLDKLVKKVKSHYREKIQYQCSKMKLLNISQQIDIDNLYVDVNILRDIPSQRYTSISQLIRGFDPTANDFNRLYLGIVPYKRVPGLEVIRDSGKVMVLGKPGSGKSTFLQYIAIECNKENLQPNKVPIFIRLLRFVEDAKEKGSLSLVDYINDEFYHCGIKDSQVIERLLKAGRCLILLDGLDEIILDDSKRLANYIRQFCDRYHNNSLVITCRTNAQQYSFKDSGFIEVEMADFNNEQIKEFAKKWFSAIYINEKEVGKNIAKSFIKKLNLKENKRIRALAVTPILLHLSCLFFRDRNSNFPASRAELYEEGLSILLSEWDDSRGIQRDEVYKNLLLEDKQRLLIYVAASLFIDNNYFIREEILHEIITDYLEIPVNQSKKVLKSIEDQHGLIVERAQGIYSFSHLTFQEYLTAKGIIASSHNLSYLKNWLDHLTEPRWREVFLLLGELLYLLPNADNLLLLLKEKIDNIGAEDEKLQQFLAWVNQKSLCLDESYRKVAVRVFYATLVPEIIFNPDRNFIRNLDTNFTRACDYALNLARTTELKFDKVATLSSHNLAVDISLNLTLILAINISNNSGSELTQLNRFSALHRALDFAVMLHSEFQGELQQLKGQLPQKERNIQKLRSWWKGNGQAWTEYLRHLMIKYCNIGHTWQARHLQLDDEDSEIEILTRFSNKWELSNIYYESTKLLVTYLNSGCNVSSEIRERIEDELLLPITEIERRRQKN